MKQPGRFSLRRWNLSWTSRLGRIQKTKSGWTLNTKVSPEAVFGLTKPSTCWSLRKELRHYDIKKSRSEGYGRHCLLSRPARSPRMLKRGRAIVMVTGSRETGFSFLSPLTGQNLVSVRKQSLTCLPSLLSYIPWCLDSEGQGDFGQRRLEGHPQQGNWGSESSRMVEC